MKIFSNRLREVSPMWLKPAPVPRPVISVDSQCILTGPCQGNWKRCKSLNRTLSAHTILSKDSNVVRVVSFLSESSGSSKFQQISLAKTTYVNVCQARLTPTRDAVSGCWVWPTIPKWGAVTQMPLSDCDSLDVSVILNGRSASYLVLAKGFLPNKI